MPRTKLVTALASALVLLPLSLASAQQDAPPLPLGSHAPAFQSRTTAGRPFSLRSLRGHVVLMDFWATWCGPCRMATPTLEGLQRKYAGRGLRVVGVSVDDPTTVAQVPAFAKQMHVTYTLVASPAQDIKAAQRYNAGSIPTQFLIDKKGVIRWAQAGFSPSEGPELSALIQKLLTEKA